ncbi:PTS sugar transporter subunit IIA [uncultured Desulfosarcina sp.]|uniref:PTS sugar transporter subunit IIA n=1 Tax=uncultured Desulfosarcina sp. TaxID=218289 RepID=UPI0029C75B75|nr:PTS sugar transporter subunit IIA [uncultured Desulfosarcina sp.]
MKRSLKTVADALDLPLTTVERWIRQGRIPLQRDGSEAVFSPSALERWAGAHHLSFSLSGGKADDDAPEALGSLVSAMERGKVCCGIAGADAAAVLHEIVACADFLSEDIREELYEKLMERERLASTGIGNGIAIPHPREPLSKPPEAPIIATCFTEKPVPYGAIDDQPITTLFLLISPTVKHHLHLLSRLSYCIRDGAFVDFLQTQPEAGALHARIAEFEKRLDDL